LTRIILIRHGQTQWNERERFRGRADLDLTDLGVRQSHITAEAVAKWPVSALYSSPLPRAMHTAQILAHRLQVPVQPLPGIIDVDYGQWQGLSVAEVAARYSELFEVWRTKPHLVTFPGGEGVEAVRLRAKAAMEEVAQQHLNQTIALVSHVVVCRLLVLSVLGLDSSYFWRVEQNLCAINIFEVRDGYFVAALLNDTCHLKRAGLEG